MKKLHQTFNVRSLRRGLLALALGSMMAFSAPSYAVNVNSASAEILQNVKVSGQREQKQSLRSEKRMDPL